MQYFAEDILYVSATNGFRDLCLADLFLSDLDPPLNDMNVLVNVSPLLILVGTFVDDGQEDLEEAFVDGKMR